MRDLGDARRGLTNLVYGHEVGGLHTAILPRNPPARVTVGRSALTGPSVAYAIVDARMCGALARLGALGVLNLEGLQTRHDDPSAALERIATAADDEMQAVL